MDGPLLVATRPEWAALAVARLDHFLADHAICEQQAAQSAMALVGQYPADRELVERMAALAAEEIGHFRKVVALLHRRDVDLSERRPNPWVRSLKEAIDSSSEPELECDRLLVAALVEARSSERFACLLGELERQPEANREAIALLGELAPAEDRHWRMFHALAERLLPSERFEARWRHWLEFEASLAPRFGVGPTVHG